MSRREKLLDAMSANAGGDWTIADVERLCKAYGVACKAPKRGSHYVVSHPTVTGHLTVPARRPIKAIYIKLLVNMIEAVT